MRAFDKVNLKPGETKKVSLEIAAKDLAWYNPEKKDWTVDEMEYELYTGSSSAEEDLLKSSFIVK